MQSVTVIKHRYVIQNILLGFISGLVVPPVHPFLLQAAEEAFHNSVSQQSPFWLMLPLMPWAFNNFLKALLAYCDPRSEWWINPAFGLRNKIAIINASRTN